MSNKHRLFAAILVVILVISMLASLIVPYLSLRKVISHHSISMPPEPQHLCCGPNRLPGGTHLFTGRVPFCDRISLRSAL